MATLILTGGGTAGHCIPCIALLPFLKNDFDKIVYFGSENGIEREVVSKTDLPYYDVPCAKLRRDFSLKNLTIPVKVLSGIKKAGKIMDEIKPDAVFSKGGYVAVPVVIAAKRRNIPVISHESDYTVGLANKIISRYCKKVLTAFPETAKSLKNGEYCGLPLKRSLYSPCDKKEILSSFGFNGSKPVLLVTGGSQGAKIINDVVRKALPLLTQNFDVLHVCGKGNLSGKEQIEGYFETEFMNKMENAFKIADVCVTRAGANTLFELLSVKVPCVLIPLCGKATRGDQVLNAEYFQKLGTATVLPQSVLTPESLTTAVSSAYAGRDDIRRAMEKHPVKDASRQISRIIADLLH